MATDRREARILAMQALCQWEVHQDTSPNALAGFLSTVADELEADSAARYAAQLVRAYWAQSDDIDKLIAETAAHWDLPRMSPVDRNVMRIAVVEMQGQHAPPKVALNEAIEIGRVYGGAESPRFINGILGKILSRFQKDDD